MKRNEMIVHNFSIWMKCNFQGCSFIVNGAKLSLDNGRIGERWIVFRWPKKGREENFELLSMEHSFGKSFFQKLQQKRFPCQELSILRREF